MTLAEAVRLGAAQRPQCYGLPFRYEQPGILGSCFAGAAYEGLTDTVDLAYARGSRVYDVLRATFPIASRPVVCPVGGCGDSGPLLSGATHLNDWHEWTREQIADWVSELEAA
jgi:hypothetical protein